MEISLDLLLNEVKESCQSLCFSSFKNALKTLLAFASNFTQKIQYEKTIKAIENVNEKMWLDLFIFYKDSNQNTNLIIQQLLFWDREIPDYSYSEYNIVPGKRFKGLLARCFYCGYKDLFDKLLNLIIKGIKYGMAIYMTRALYSFSFIEAPSISKDIVSCFSFPKEWLNEAVFFNQHNDISELFLNHSKSNIVCYANNIGNIRFTAFYGKDKRIIETNHKEMYNKITEQITSMIVKSGRSCVDLYIVINTLYLYRYEIEYIDNLEDDFQIFLLNSIISCKDKNNSNPKTDQSIINSFAGILPVCYSFDNKYLFHYACVLIVSLAQISSFFRNNIQTILALFYDESKDDSLLMYLDAIKKYK